MEMKALWPGWETVKLIGRGSFGAVYEIQRQVFADTEKAALKVISIPQNESDLDEMYSDGYDDESITSTFQNHLQSIVTEYSLMRKMNGSAHIVNCDDVQYNPHRDGIGWDVLIKMELLTPLTKALPDVIPEETVVQIATDMCTALELCRKYGIVHRDIKPQNIFVSKHGDYKLGDFGIAKTVEKTMGGTKIGTYKYMAPEVYHNQPYGAAADIYSLGLVLYWLLNQRRLPFMPLPPEKLKAGMEEEARDRRFAGDPIPAPKNGSEELKRIVLKACAFHPSSRYASASEMLADLKQLGQDSLGQASIVLSSAAATESPENDNTVGVFGTACAIHTVIPDSLEKEAARRKAEEAVHRKAEEARRKAEEDARHKTEAEARRKEEEARREADQRKKKLWAILGVAAAAIAVVAVILALSLRKTPPPPTSADDSNEAVCAHIWRPADCVTPQTCSKCGIANGSPADHRWTAATCTAPRTCTACGLADGMPADHQWMAATCTAPKTCHVCGFTSDAGKVNADAIPDEMTSKDGKYQVAFVTDVGQLKDKGFNQGSYDGVKLFANGNGKSYKYYQPANGDAATDDDRINAMKLACENGAEIVVAAGFLQAGALEAAAKAYPDVHFVFIDGWPLGLDNVAAIAFDEHQSGYLAGYATVMEGYTKLGFMGGGGGTNPACQRFGNGFAQGTEAAAAKKGVKVELKYSWAYGAGFGASPELQAMATGWYQNGTEVIFACGGSMFSSISAAAAAEDAKVVGVDVDQSGESTTVITSAMKGLADAVQWAVDKHNAGKWSEVGGTLTSLGAKDNAVGLPTATWSLKNFSVADYEALFADLVSGKVVVSDELVLFPENTANVTVTYVE